MSSYREKAFGRHARTNAEARTVARVNEPASRKAGLERWSYGDGKINIVGIAVSKTRLNVAPRSGAETFSTANHQRAIASLVKQLRSCA